MTDQGEVQEFSGGAGTIWVFEDKIRIKKHGLGGLWQGGAWKGEEEFPIASVTTIGWRDAGRFKEGYIQFVVSGGVDQRDPYHDQKAVIFAKRNQPKFEAARALVEQRRKQLSQRASGSVPLAPDVMDQLRKLGELRDAGVLTAQEFEAKKVELLARL